MNAASARLGARAALAAIALHLILSFGHVHEVARPALPSIGAFHADSPDAPPPGTAADDSCAICANIAAFAGLALPALLALIGISGWVVFAGSIPWACAPPSAHYRLFRSRAPPLSSGFTDHF